MTITALYWVILALFGIGLYLAAHLVLELAADLLGGIAGLVRRRLQPAAVQRLLALVQEEAHPAQKITRLTPRLALSGLTLWRPFWAAAGILAALLLSDSLFSPLALVVILVGGELYRSTFISRRTARLNEDAGNLIIQVVSRYPINRSLSKTLKDAADTLPDGEVRRAALEATARLGMNQASGEALQPLRAVRHPVLTRLAVLLSNVQDTNQDVLMRTLELLQEDVQSRLGLRQQARQSLTTLRGTVRILQGVVVAAMIVAGTLPAWRFYFTSSPKNWALFIVMLATATLGSLYVESEMRQLEV